MNQNRKFALIYKILFISWCNTELEQTDKHEQIFMK